MMHAQEAAMQEQRRQMILERQRIDDDIYAQRLLGKLDDNDDHVQVRLRVLSCLIKNVSFLSGSVILNELRLE
jgi:hypothetical protein